MTRITQLSPEKMSKEQHRIYDEIAARIGRLLGPYVALLHNHELADKVQKLGKFLRNDTSLPKRLVELATLITARVWTAQFEWYAHAPLALEAGIEQDVISAIANRQKPDFTREDEELVYQFSTELHDRKTVSESTYQAALKQLGEQGVVELVALNGFYTLIAMTLNTFELLPPEGATHILPD